MNDEKGDNVDSDNVQNHIISDIKPKIDLEKGFNLDRTQSID